MLTAAYLRLSACAAMFCFLAGCGSSSKETEAKLEAMEKQLAETQKKMEEAQASAATAVKEQANKAAAAVSDAGSQVKGKAQDAAKTEAAQGTADEAKAEAAQRSADEAKAVAAPPPSHTLAAGTRIAVRTGTVISTKSTANGSTFEASLAEPLVVDGFRVADRGASVEGIVTNADPGGRMKGVASISIALRSIVMDDGRRLPIRTNSVSEDAKSSKKKDAKRIGIATGIGAAIGAIAGGGKGAAIGAGVGGGTGVGATMATRGAAAEIPSESLLTFTLSSAAKFQELKR